ncbi:hypothetical protein RN001_001223 [Aquatica leii]|uniref:C2H2-type domain-containing protein n=1 Tax=Aquatica leii TaxID=1421715 RepID=A0AAN7PFU3_9COLE|nr:hypothetical protein RN001_001223 [Aquatica leii]
MASKFPEVITSIAAAVLEIVQKNLFWDQIRREIGIELPLHIKILLHFNGYESAASIKNVSDSLFTELEEFAKEELYTFMDSNDFKPDFYGIYYNNISKFRILSGYRHSIKEIQNYIKEKSLLHFCPNEVDKVNREVDRKSQEKLLGATSKQAEKISVARTKTSTNDSLLLFHETALYNIIKKFYLAVDNSKTLFTTFFNGSKRQFVQVFIKEDTAGDYNNETDCKFKQDMKELGSVDSTLELKDCIEITTNQSKTSSFRIVCDSGRECFPVIGSCQVSSILSTLDTSPDKALQTPSDMAESMDLIVLQNPDYKISTQTDLNAPHTDFILLKDNISNEENLDSAPDNKIVDDKENNITKDKKLKGTDDFENMLYFVCNLCPYLCIKDSKITEHLEIEHKNKTSVKPTQLKCPACPNIFYHKLPLRSHLVYDHKVSNSDLRKIIQAVTYFSKKGITASGKTLETKTDKRKEAEVCYKNEIDAKLIEKLMNSNEVINTNSDKIKDCSQLSSDSFVLPKIQLLKDVQYKDSEKVTDIQLVPETLPPLITVPLSETLNTVSIEIKKKPDTLSKYIDQKKLHKCTISMCKIRLQDSSKMDYHVKCHAEGAFKCPECLELFSFWKPLTGHLWRVHKIDMELYSCDMCDYKTFSLGKLNNIHRLIHSDHKAFNCDVCQKAFKNTKQLRNHKITHKEKSNQFNHVCAICEKVFTNRRQMRVHMDGVHNKIKPFLCNYCGYKGASKSALKMHIRQHTGEKPFSCDFCEYTTADHNSLRRHKLRHTGHKPYKCEHCDYACIQSSTYKVHLRTKHPGLEKDYLFICQECQFKTVNQDMYLSHLFLVHRQKVQVQSVQVYS